MSEAFKRIEKSLKEAIAFAEGKKVKARVTVFDLGNPEQEKNVTASRQNLQDLILTAPTLTDEEAQEFDEAREWMRQWRAKPF